MKKLTIIHVSLSLTLVLALGAAGSVFYARDAAALRSDVMSPKADQGDVVADAEADADLLDKWKSTARTTDYISPRVPI